MKVEEYPRSGVRWWDGGESFSPGTVAAAEWRNGHELVLLSSHAHDGSLVQCTVPELRYQDDAHRDKMGKRRRKSSDVRGGGELVGASYASHAGLGVVLRKGGILTIKDAKRSTQSGRLLTLASTRLPGDWLVDAVVLNCSGRFTVVSTQFQQRYQLMVYELVGSNAERRSPAIKQIGSLPWHSNVIFMRYSRVRPDVLLVVERSGEDVSAVQYHFSEDMTALSTLKRGRLSMEATAIAAIDWSPVNENIIAIATTDGTLIVAKINSALEKSNAIIVAISRGHTQACSQLVWHPDGNVLAATFGLKTLVVFDNALDVVAESTLPPRVNIDTASNAPPCLCWRPTQFQRLNDHTRIFECIAVVAVSGQYCFGQIDIPSPAQRLKAGLGPVSAVRAAAFSQRTSAAGEKLADLISVLISKGHLHQVTKVAILLSECYSETKGNSASTWERESRRAVQRLLCAGLLQQALRVADAWTRLGYHEPMIDCIFWCARRGDKPAVLAARLSLEEAGINLSSCLLESHITQPTTRIQTKSIRDSAFELELLGDRLSAAQKYSEFGYEEKGRTCLHLETLSRNSSPATSPRQSSPAARSSSLPRPELSPLALKY